MKSMAIFLTLTIAAAFATVACGDKTPAADPTSATAASGETPSTDLPAPSGSDDTAAPVSSGM